MKNTTFIIWDDCLGWILKLNTGLGFKTKYGVRYTLGQQWGKLRAPHSEKKPWIWWMSPARNSELDL